MIDEKKLIEDIKDDAKRILSHVFSEVLSEVPLEFIDDYLKQMEWLVNDQPKVDEWIPCSKRLPEERDSIFKKFKDTNKWNKAMFEEISEDVNVTVEYEDGTRKTMTSHTLDGIWACEKDIGIKKKVIAWMPLVEPYKE